MAAAWAPAGCNSDNTCSGTYNCPAILLGQVDLPATATGQLTSVAADAPCEVSELVGDMEGSVFVTVKGSLAPNATITCQVHGTLSDGSELLASVSFKMITGCCAALTSTNSPTTFQLVGADAATGE